MSLEEVGSVLKEEREKKGYSVDTVASRLKISARVIRALEEADPSSLPHAAYVRGFVRSYGTFLGFPAEEVESLAKAVEVDDSTMPTPPTPMEDCEPRGGKGKYVGMAVMVLCVIGALFFWLNRDVSLFSDETLQRLTTAIPLPATKPAPTAPTEQAATTAGKGASATPATPAAKEQGAAAQRNEQPRPAAAAQGTQQGAQQDGAQSAGTTPTQGPAQTPAAQGVGQPVAQGIPGQGAPAGSLEEAARQAAGTVASGQHKIIITALAECWIHSSADGTDTRQFSLRKGDTFALTFAKKLELKLGNAGGVRLRYNGQDMPAAGKDGQVRTLVFPPAAQ